MELWRLKYKNNEQTMAILKNTSTNEVVILLPHHIFGRRHSRVDTVLSSADISQTHACISWTAQGWQLVDHSKNGTSIDGERIRPDLPVTLQRGQQIQFGRLDRTMWRVIDLGAPAAILVPVKNTSAFIELKTFHLLPNTEQAEMALFRDIFGDWVCETCQEMAALNDGDSLQVAGRVWQYFGSGIMEATPTYTKAGDFHFYFDTNLEQDKVHLRVQYESNSFDLGVREHHRVLLALARQRHHDLEAGLPDSEQGWLSADALEVLPTLGREQICSEIFRAREQFSVAVEPRGFVAQLVQRQDDKIRFGFDVFSIVRDSLVEVDIDATLGLIPND